MKGASVEIHGDSFLRKLYDFFNKHWLVSALIASMSGAWFSIVKFIKPPFIVDAADNLTLLGHWVTWPVFGVSVFFIVMKSYGDRRNELLKTSGYVVSSTLLQCVNSVTKYKLDRFYEFIRQNYSNQEALPFKEITQPKKQIRSILEYIQVALSEIFGIDRDDITLCVLYKDSENADWAFLERINVSSSLGVRELTTNRRSTFYRLMHSEGGSVFYPSKVDAINRSEYLPSPKDSVYNNIGSVFVCDISMKNDSGKDDVFSAVLCVSTFGKQLCDEKDDDAITKIKTKIIPVFESRIRLEMALLFIKEGLLSRCTECFPKSE